MSENKWRMSHLRNEKGAVSLEFLGTLPYYFLLFLLLWQVVASGYAIMTARSAASEAAKVYSLTGNRQEADSMARSILGNAANLQYEGMSINDTGDNFQVRLESRHSLVLVPKQWRSSASIELDQTASGRLIN